MILPGTQDFEGRIGTTWDQIMTIYPSTYNYVTWVTKKDPAWNSTLDYIAKNGVLGEDGEGYVCLVPNVGVNPVGDVSGKWEKMTPLDLTGYTSEFKTLGLVLKDEEGVTLGGVKGTARIKMQPSQTEKAIVSKIHFALLLTDGEKNLYEYVEGGIKWKAQ